MKKLIVGFLLLISQFTLAQNTGECIGTLINEK